MKKIRILAIVLALLMLPIGILASCTKTPADNPDDSSSDTGDIELRTTDPTSVVRDNDGAKSGYLMFFNFDVASNGNLKTDPPYSTYLSAATGKSGCIYVVDPSGKLEDGQSKSGCLLIQREGSNADGYVDVKLDNIKSLIQSQHIVEFDVKLGEGIFSNDGAGVYGVKGTVNQYFVKFKNGTVTDGDGAKLYPFDDDTTRTEVTTEEWVHVALAIDDAKATYNIYINGVKCTADLKYGASFPAASDTPANNYRFAINAGTGTNEYLYVDNIAISNGSEPSLYTESKVVYKDSFVERLPIITATKEGFVKFLTDFKKTGFVHEDPYTSTGYRLDEMIGLYILTTEGKETTAEPVTTEYFVLMGTDYFGGEIGGWTFVKDDTSYKFVSESDMKVIKTVGETVTEGTYAVSGSKDRISVTVTFKGELEDVKEYFVAVGDELTVSDDKFALPETDAVVFAKDTTAEREVTDFVMPELAENQKFAIRISNFATVGETKSNAMYSDFDETKWNYAEFNYYVSNPGYTWMFYYDTANSAEGWSYFSKALNANQADMTVGFHTISGNPSSLGSSRQADMVRYTGVNCISFSGWSNGPSGGTAGTAADGYEVFIVDWAFKRDNSVVVEGPDKDHPDCQHVDDSGASTLVKLEEAIPATCTVGSFYVSKCSICGATKIVAELGLISEPTGHNFEGVVAKVVSATCDTDGYTSRKCVDCGFEEISDVVKATGHDNYSVYDGQTAVMVLTCKKCGQKSSFALSKEMMTGVEKRDAAAALVAANGGASYAYLVAEGENDAYTYGGFTGEQNTTNGAISINAKYCVFEGKQFSDGSYGIEYTRPDSTGSFSDAYVDINPSGLTKGEPFVFEVDLKLGKKGTDGKYVQIGSNFIERQRTDGGTGNYSGTKFFDMKDDGTIVFASNAAYTVTLSETKFTNVAIYFDTKTPCYNIYIDGILTFENIAVQTYDWSTLTVDNIRMSYGASRPGEANGSFIFNNILCYNATSPICVTGIGNVTAGNSETVGEMHFVDAEKEAVTSVTGGLAPQQVDIAEGEFASKYVTSFKLTASSLSDGAVISGIKDDQYGFTHTLDLITAKYGYVYFLDKAICDVSDLASGATIKLVSNDSANKITVFVNGEEIPGTFSYPAGYYAEGTSYLKSYVFSAGTYTVSDLAMTAGLEG